MSIQKVTSAAGLKLTINSSLQYYALDRGYESPKVASCKWLSQSLSMVKFTELSPQSRQMVQAALFTDRVSVMPEYQCNGWQHD